MNLGQTDLDVSAMKRATKYVNCAEGDNLVVWFWEVVEAMTVEQRRQLIRFMTGLHKAPGTSFNSLQLVI